jgi:hypothetical protein
LTDIAKSRKNKQKYTEYQIANGSEIRAQQLSKSKDNDLIKNSTAYNGVRNPQMSAVEN